VNKNTESLAVNGGPKTREAGWPARKTIGQAERDAVMALFDDAVAAGNPIGYGGAQEEAYCKEFSEFLGGGFADGVCSGTNALYIALRTLEVAPYSEVICPPCTDPGGVMPVPLANLIPIIADSAPDSYNVGPDQIEARITDHTGAIIVTHIAGIPADMDPILEIAKSRNIPVIEDCAQAHGAKYKGRYAGTFGDIAAFSTMFSKHHCTGGQGGVVFTKNEALYWKARQLADRGKSFGIDIPMTNVVASLNSNMDEISGTLGQAQLKRLPEMIAARRACAQAIAEGCKSLQSVSLVTDPPECESSYWFLFFKIDTDKLTVDKDTFAKAVKAEGLPVEHTYLNVFTDQPWYKERAVFGEGLPWTAPQYKGDANAEYAIPNMLATDACHFRMHFHAAIGQEVVDDTIAALKKVEAAYLK